MFYLKMQRPIPKGCTSFYAFGTTNTELFINGIFKIGFFDKFPGNSCCRTELVFSGSIKDLYTLPEITTTEITVATHLK